MYLRAAELGWTLDEFESASLARFIWEWSGYTRRLERMNEVNRISATIMHNVNAKKGSQKSIKKLIPFTIDSVTEFTYDDAVKQYERVKQLGWISNN